MTDTNPDVAAGRWLEYFTLGWNALEAIIAVGAGLLAGSTALIGFGLDSVIESLSGAVLLWRLRDGTKGEEREQRALKLVGVSFLILAVYIAYEATETLIKQEPPDVSYVGIGLARRIGDRHATAGSGEAEGGGPVEQPCLARRFTADGYLLLFVGDSPSWLGSQRTGWLVVGRSSGGTTHGADYRQRGCGCTPWRVLHVPR